MQTLERCAGLLVEVPTQMMETLALIVWCFGVRGRANSYCALSICTSQKPRRKVLVLHLCRFSAKQHSKHHARNSGEVLTRKNKHSRTTTGKIVHAALGAAVLLIFTNRNEFFLFIILSQPGNVHKQTIVALNMLPKYHWLPLKAIFFYDEIVRPTIFWVFVSENDKKKQYLV
jgi:hypothetical protein